MNFYGLKHRMHFIAKKGYDAFLKIFIHAVTNDVQQKPYFNLYGSNSIHFQRKIWKLTCNVRADFPTPPDPTIIIL